MTPKPVRAAALGAVAFTALALCMGLAACGHSDPTRFFTLDALPPTAPTAYAGPPLRVRAVHIPPALDRAELARETSPGEVSVDDFAHWAAPLGQTARQVLTEDLAARLPSGEIGPPNGPLPPGGADLDVEILSLNVAGGQAVMQASWSLVAPGAVTGGRPVLVELQAPAAEVGPEAVSQGFSRLLGQLSDRIAADLVQRQAR